MSRPFPLHFLSLPLSVVLLAGSLTSTAQAVMYNRDTGDQPSRALALLPPFASRAIMSGGGCTAVIIAPDAALCAAHCKDYAASGSINITWNGQTRAGSFLKIGADHIVVKLDSAFTGTAGKMTAPYAGNTENGRLAWKVAQGGHGILGPGSHGAVLR